MKNWGCYVVCGFLGVRTVLVLVGSGLFSPEHPYGLVQRGIQRSTGQGVLIAFVACCSFFGLRVDVYVFLFYALCTACFLFSVTRPVRLKCLDLHLQLHLCLRHELDLIALTILDCMQVGSMFILILHDF